MASGLVAASVLGALVATAGAAPPRPGPAPIVVTGSGSEPIRVNRGGEVRIVAPATTAMVATPAPEDDSAFDVPEPQLAPDPELEAEWLEGEQPAEGAVDEQDTYDDEAARGYAPGSRRSSGYQPSSSLNQRLPGAASTPFADGHAPSSSLNERMAAQASTQMNTWPAGDLADSRTVGQWSNRGSQSRSGTP